MNRRFIEIARDPHLIPGVYEHCNQWCTYCKHTRRCLANRCMIEFARTRGRDPSGTVFETLDEIVQFTRDVAAAAGRTTPELDALVAGRPTGVPLDTLDPIAYLAFEYAALASLALNDIAARLSPPARGTPRPTAFEVALWFHMQIATATNRATLSAAQVAAGAINRAADVQGFAKVALLAIARSRVAWEELSAVTDVSNLDALRSYLDTLEAALDERFPRARTFIRPGLDVPVA